MAGAYAMDAMDSRDRSRFERHLARCPECSQEISGLHEATARLATAAAEQPAASLKERLLADTVLIRQLPPRPRRQRARRPVWAARAAMALAGVFLVTAAAVWVTGRAHQPPLARQAPRSHAIATVLTAPDAAMISTRVRTGGTATVVMSHRERMLVFAAAGLRALPASRRYELWLLGPGSDRAAGLLPLPRHGMSGPVLASGLEPGDRLGLTVEPVRGSRRPTSAMILVLAL
jgi:anti-sigma-K factor RskA